MNEDTLKGEGRNLGGKVTEAVGKVTGDQATEAQGVADQISGNLQQSYGAAKDAVAQGVGPLADKARTFAKERPWATAALVGTLALAVINTLRGKKA
ncbi:CsbD family protein [Sphingomonas sp. QA11]|uniref:CsbD family protein n=1 Tax=Sphingomonas sp. QA11 TaxID=2950605 RepID=UPI002349396F|nr:CsbD family protein [Sphingomonas sp. QA11]WCM26477.1 CsbD family protein [Sphingomonas sp. QA11]